MKIENDNEIKPNSTLIRVRKTLTYLAIFILLILITALIYLYINMDDISRDLLNKINKSQNGEVSIEKISLAPFEQFPSFSIKLDNVVYYENPSLFRINNEEPFCRLENAFLSLNLLDLLNGKINITKMTLKGGHFRVVTYQDSTTNLYNAISTKNDSTYHKEIEEIDTIQVHDEADQQESIDFFSINNLTIKNVTLEFENNLFKRKSSILIEQFKASFNHESKMNLAWLESDLKLNYYILNNRTILKNNSIHIATDLTYDANKNFIAVDSCNMGFDGAIFDFAGSFNLSDGDINLQINGSDKNFSILALFMKDDFIRNNRKDLIKGSYYFDGIVKGKTYNEVPYIELSFGVKDVNLNMARLGKSINNLNFNAYLTTGLKKDFSEAIIKLENFSAQLPDGKTYANILIKNLTKPKVKINCFLKTSLEGFDEIIKIDAIDNLGGIIKLDTKIEGVVDFEKDRIIGDKNYIDINFENVSLEIPEVISLDKINGVIKRENENLKLEDLHISIWDTDVLLNGYFNNILSLIFNVESDITAELSMASEKFNLPKVFSFDPSIGRSFNHQLNNLNLKVEAKSTTKRLMNFDSFPAIDFEIQSMNAEFDDFPNLKITNSSLSFFDDSSGFNIKYEPLNIQAVNGDLSLNGSYNGASWKPYSLISDAKVKSIDMLDLLNQFEMDLDTTSFFNSIISGSFDFKIEFPHDSLDFKILQMTNANLYIDNLSWKDTITTKSLTIELNDIYYDTKISSNPMVTLSTAGFIEGKSITTSNFNVENMRQDISATKGTYEIIPNTRSFFGAEGNGAFIIEPWAEIPNYKFKYSVENFNIQDLLSTFLEDSLLTGTMSLAMNIELIGNNWDSVKSKLNGNIHIEGNDLSLYGVDADELLKRIERSQNFTLVDLGAVLLTGPVGLAVTKGSDVALLVVSGTGEKTEIPMFVSKYSINEGIINLDDVAFSTKQNRVAAKGKISLANEIMSITFGVLNKDGSLRLSQNVSGRFSEPRMGKLNVLSSVLSPVTNLWNSVFQIEGEIFYDGAVKHPE